MITILLLFCLFIILVYYYSIRHGRFGQLIDRIPGLLTVPILGNTLDFICSPENLWKLQRSLCRNYYPIHKIWIFTTAYVGIHHPDHVEVILNSTKQHLAKGYMYTFFHPWLKTGLLTSEGTKWQTRRKMLTPTFHFNILKQFIDIMIEESNRMSKNLKSTDGMIVEDLVAFVSHHTLNMICETSMGISLENMDEFAKQYRHAVHEIGKIIVRRIWRPWLQVDMLYALTPTYKKQAKNLKILHEFTEKIIAERKQYHKATDGQYLKNFENDTVTKTNDDEVMGTKKKRLAMLDLLISHSDELTDLDIKEEVDTFMFEGHDTVAMGITYAILVLAEQKDAQDRIRKEITEAMQETGGNLTIEILNNMQYLERCLKESLRLYPSVPFISRITSEDVKLEPYLVPTGTEIYIDIHELHRDPNFWSNPDEFDPDRFLPERLRGRHPFSYVPFSAGTRNCIGQRFAMYELKALMASLIYNFYLEPIDHIKDLKFMIDVISRVTHPIRVKFVPVERTQ